MFTPRWVHNHVICVDVYTAKNATDLLQVVRFNNFKAWQIHQVATSLLKSGLSFADLLWLVETISSTPVDNKFWQSTCNKSVDNLQQTSYQEAVVSHANASWYRLVVTSCYKMSTDLLQRVHFWLCNAITETQVRVNLHIKQKTIIVALVTWNVYQIINRFLILPWVMRQQYPHHQTR